MGFTKNVQAISLETIENIKKKDAEIERLNRDKDCYSEKYFKQLMETATADREALISKGRERVGAEISSYKQGLHEAYLPKGEELTADAGVLTSGMDLTAQDINGLMEKCQGNKTMERLFHEYAEKHGMQLEHKYVSEADKAAAADDMIRFYELAISRPDFVDIWGSEEYMNEAVSEVIRGE